MRLPNGDEPPVLVEPGEYEMRYIGHRTSQVFGTAKVALWFSVVSPGPAFDALVARWYRVRSVSSPKRFRISWHGDIVREYYQLFPAPAYKIKKAADYPITRIRDHVLLGRVETVTTDHKQRQLPDSMRYSVVRELLKVA